MPFAATRMDLEIIILSEVSQREIQNLKNDTGKIKNDTGDFPGGSDGKASVYNVGDVGLIPGSGRFLGEGNGNPLQYSCLENPMDGEDW